MADDFANLSEDARAYLRKLHKDYLAAEETSKGEAQDLMSQQLKRKREMDSAVGRDPRGMKAKAPAKQPVREDRRPRADSSNESGRGYSMARTHDRKGNGVFKNSRNSSIQPEDKSRYENSQTTKRGYSTSRTHDRMGIGTWKNSKNSAID